MSNRGIHQQKNKPTSARPIQKAHPRLRLHMLRTLDRLTDRMLQAEENNFALADFDADTKRRIVRSYRCPFTGAIMTDPVIDREGISYQRANIYKWLATHGESPISGKPMTVSDLLPNRGLKDMIEATIAALNPTTETAEYILSELLSKRYELSLINHCDIGESIHPKIIRDIEIHAQNRTINDWRPDMNDTINFSYFTWNAFQNLRSNVYGEFARIQGLTSLDKFTVTNARIYFYDAMRTYPTKTRIEQVEIAIRLFSTRYRIPLKPQLQPERNIRWRALFRMQEPEPQPQDHRPSLSDIQYPTSAHRPPQRDRDFSTSTHQAYGGYGYRGYRNPDWR